VSLRLQILELLKELQEEQAGVAHLI
jgi:hypothetical protein